MSTNAASPSSASAWKSSTHVSDEIVTTAANRLTTRIGAVLFLLGLIVLVISTQLHPAHENPMDNPAVFREYAQSDLWVAVHLGQFVGFLLVVGGLVGPSPTPSGSGRMRQPLSPASGWRPRSRRERRSPSCRPSTGSP